MTDFLVGCVSGPGPGEHGGVAVAVGVDSPRAALGLVERHVALSTAAVLTGLAGGAWYLTAAQADRMSGMASGLGQVGVHTPQGLVA